MNSHIDNELYEIGFTAKCNARVFTRFTTSGGFEIAPYYREYACKKCGKIQPGIILNDAVPEDLFNNIKLPSTDFIVSDDEVLFVTQDTKSILEECFHEWLSFAPIPGYPSYYIMLPKFMIQPEDCEVAIKNTVIDRAPRYNTSYSSTGRRCSKCGTLKDCCLYTEWLNLDQNIIVGAAHVPTDSKYFPQGIYSWICRHSFVKFIDRFDLVGLRFDSFSSQREMAYTSKP